MPVRETMLLLAWAVALTDERATAEELAILTAAADGLASTPDAPTS